MSDFFDVLGSAGLWLGVILGAVASLLVHLLWTSRAHQLATLRVRMKAASETRRGRVPSLGGSMPAPGKILPDYFRQQEDEVDLAIYELSLRPDIPIMDLLYIEYLRARVENGSIARVVIVPWSGWRDEQNNDGENRIKEHLGNIFGAHFDRVTIVTAAMLQEQANAVFENEFFKQVGNLGNSEFLRTASSVMGFNFRSYHDINQGHPESHQARSIVEHTVRGWLIYKYVEKTFINSPTPPKRIGSLMWERELTKLLLLSNIVANHKTIDCSLMLGASVTYRRWLKRIPLPTYESSNTIMVFGDYNAQVPVIAKKKRAELRKTNAVLCSILASQNGLRGLPGWVGNPEGLQSVSGLQGDALALARSLWRVQRMYRNEL